ncbi:hypothetical protein HDC34_003219 [Pseudoclavibacter sp. JAI123]|nr:hypothetical protein [Pseudoclavibacter sp. JAI123]
MKWNLGDLVAVCTLWVAWLAALKVPIAAGGLSTILGGLVLSLGTRKSVSSWPYMFSVTFGILGTAATILALVFPETATLPSGSSSSPSAKPCTHEHRS